ncbi:MULTISPECIES: hypothetical protein [unclassified Xanthobacter]|uniref:hypothetical protein n=1 Tax=unclassified Xanthobacter TaxID=2623496 RepID=UPI001F1C05CA|nr:MULTISPECIES: hypothetical protein [unclassified Xanthobacter]
MSIIKYIDAPAGAGKSTFIYNNIADLASNREKFILAVPTTELANTSANKLKELTNGRFTVTLIHGEDGSSGNVASRIIAAMKSFHADYGQVIVITHAGFDCVPYFHRPNHCNLIFDECPTPIDFFELTVPHSHEILTNHLSTGGDGTYVHIFCKKKKNLADIIAKGRNDEVYAQFRDVAVKITSLGWDTMVKADSYEALLSGKSTTDTLHVHAVRNARILGSFKSCTIISARFKESILFHTMQNYGVTFEPHPVPDGSFEYLEHQNGHLLTIHYPDIKRISKNIMNNNPSLVKNIKDYSISLFASNKFIFLSNKGMSHIDLIMAGGIELSGCPHGSNNYRHIHNSLIFPAYNLNPEQTKFLEYLGLDGPQIEVGIHCHGIYQAFMRCSVRDGNSKEPKHLIVPDKRTADWLLEVFPGSTLKLIPTAKADATLGKSGRPQKYESNAKRQKAYRDRKKAEKAAAKLAPESDRQQLANADRYKTSIESINSFVTIQEHMLNGNQMKTNISSNVHIFTGAENNNSHIISGDVQAFSSSDFVVTRGICEDIEAREPLRRESFEFRAVMNFYSRLDTFGSDGVIAFDSIDEIVDTFRGTFDIYYEKPSGPGFFNFTKFACNPSESKRQEDALSSRVMILDNDGGGISHKKFVNILSSEKILICNTRNSTANNPRWRAIIFLSDEVSVSNYCCLFDGIMGELARHGYTLAKADPKKPYSKAHGFDTSKRNINAIFRLPCQAYEEGGSFFHDYVGDDRQLMDVKAWIAKAPVPRAPQPAEGQQVLQMTEWLTELPEAVKRAIADYETEGIQPKNGNYALFKLGCVAAGAGMPEAQVRELLEAEARKANTPKDRLRQIPWIIQSLKGYGAFTSKHWRH